MSPTFRSLHVRNYRVYAMGSLISNIGTWMQTTAQAWLVLVLTDSGSALGITIALQLLPTLLLSPLGGVLADRFSKRTVLRVMQVTMAVPAAVLGVLAVTGVVQTWHVFVIAFVFGIGRALEAPARQSFVPEMVGREDLGNAVALNSASFNAGRLIGPAVAGLLIAGPGRRHDGYRLGDPGECRQLQRGVRRAEHARPRPAHPHTGHRARRRRRPRRPAVRPVPS